MISWVEMRLTFVQLRTYVADAQRLGMTDDDQAKLESALLERPTTGSVMPGTGGLRKLRYAPARSFGGKSGGVRVCYAYFPEFAIVYFVVAFGKNEQANLAARQKSQIRSLLREIQRYLAGETL
jgi:hypothetical protein